MRLVLALLVLGAGCSNREPTLSGRFSIEGDEALTRLPTDTVRHIYPNDCLSVEPAGLFGVHLFTTRGDLRFVHASDGPVLSFHPDEEDFTPWEVKPAVCDVFRGELKRNAIEVEEVSAMRGSLELDCTDQHGLRVYGEVAFDGCTDDPKY